MAIRNVVFDLGGVIVDLDTREPVRRFQEIGVADAAELLDPYEQKGLFLELENGTIGVEDFRRELSRHTGRELPMKDVVWAWLGFIAGVEQGKLDYILKLREHYKVYLLSNTNPVVQEEWARTDRFSPAGRPINDYFDRMYTSYEAGITKPDPAIFRYMLDDTGMIPAETLFVDDGEKNVAVARSLGFVTYQPANGEDWREPVARLLV